MTAAKHLPGRESDVLTAIGLGASGIEAIGKATGLRRSRVKVILGVLMERREIMRIRHGVYDVRGGVRTRPILSRGPSTLEPSSIAPIPLNRLMGGRA